MASGKTPPRRAGHGPARSSADLVGHMLAAAAAAAAWATSGRVASMLAVAGLAVLVLIPATRGQAWGPRIVSWAILVVLAVRILVSDA